MDKKLWFRAKKYGWGWYPATWQGWVVILVWAIFFFFGVLEAQYGDWFKNFFFTFSSTIILIWVCYKKGEKPKWRWGDSDSKK